MTKISAEQYYSEDHHNNMICDLYERLINNPADLQQFILKAHQVAYDSFYRDLGKEGTTEYMAKTIPQLQAFFEGDA